MTATTSRKRADDLTASRDGIVSAIETAQAALVGLADAIAEHNTLARRHAETETATRGSVTVVDGAEVLRITHQRVHVTHYEPRLGHLVHSTGRGTRSGQVAAELVARVAPPEPTRSTISAKSTEETSS